MSGANPYIIQCDDAPLSAKTKADAGARFLHLAATDLPGYPHNLALDIEQFDQLVHLVDDRVRDLLEIAAFIYGADRLITRGKPNQLEYSNWSRSLIFHIAVRDHSFWNQAPIIAALQKVLLYLSGDKEYSFHFTKKKPASYQSRLFTSPPGGGPKADGSLPAAPEVALFSGGLDSLAGVINLLETTKGKVVLTSHRANSKTTNVQNRVYQQLVKAYPNRLLYFPLECHLTNKERAVEETQRTRFFLYTVVAFALARTFGHAHINIFENGVTSINLPKRQDLINGRASRTTHPQSLRLLNEFYSLVVGQEFTVRHPFLDLTKTEVVELIAHHGKAELIAATVTCTKTFKSFEHRSHATQCGYCSQCVDRRFAMLAAGLDAHDTLYDYDLATDSFPTDNLEAAIHVNDYLRLAAQLNKLSFDGFCDEYFSELADLVPQGVTMAQETEHLNALHDLFRRHSNKVSQGIKLLFDRHVDPLKPIIPNSIYTFVNDRSFLRPEVEKLAELVGKQMQEGIPLIFQRQRPSHENVLNDAVEALLNDNRSRYLRECPTTPFSFSKVIPDHEINGGSRPLYIESKLLSRNTPPSKVTDQLISDLGKYCNGYTLFLLYDPERRIPKDSELKASVEIRWPCQVYIIR